MARQYSRSPRLIPVRFDRPVTNGQPSERHRATSSSGVECRTGSTGTRPTRGVDTVESIRAPPDPRRRSTQNCTPVVITRGRSSAEAPNVIDSGTSRRLDRGTSGLTSDRRLCWQSASGHDSVGIHRRCSLQRVRSKGAIWALRRLSRSGIGSSGSAHSVSRTTVLNPRRSARRTGRAHESASTRSGTSPERIATDS